LSNPEIIEAAKENGIIVTSKPGAKAVAVAELTLGLLLNLARPMMYVVRQTRDG